MKTLNEFIKELTGVVEQSPKFGELPVVYSTDGGDISYDYCHYDVNPAQFHEVGDDSIDTPLEIVGVLNTCDEDSQIDINDVNAIIIN